MNKCTRNRSRASVRCKFQMMKLLYKVYETEITKIDVWFFVGDDSVPWFHGKAAGTCLLCKDPGKVIRKVVSPANRLEWKTIANNISTFAPTWKIHTIFINPDGLTELINHIGGGARGFSSWMKQVIAQSSSNGGVSDEVQPRKRDVDAMELVGIVCRENIEYKENELQESRRKIQKLEIELSKATNKNSTNAALCDDFECAQDFIDALDDDYNSMPPIGQIADTLLFDFDDLPNQTINEKL